MTRTLLPSLSAATALGLCLATLPASAKGLLGERYASLSYDHIFTQSDGYDNGEGTTVFYNQPLFDGVDIGGRYAYAAYGDADGRDELGDFSDQRLELMLTGYGDPERDRIWVRLGAGVGTVEHGDEDTTNFCWTALIGTEYALSDRAYLHPYAGWSDVINDSETTSFVYGLQLSFDVVDKAAVNLRVQGDHRYNVVLSLGGLVRF